MAEVGNPGRIATGVVPDGPEADRLARLERDAVHDDPRAPPRQDAVRQVAGPLARPAAEQDEVGGASPRSSAASSARRVVADDPQGHRLAPQLADGVGQQGRVGVVDRRPGAAASPGAMISSPVERIATRGRRTTATSPRPIAASTPGLARGQPRPAPQDQLAPGHVGPREADVGPRRDRPGDDQAVGRRPARARPSRRRRPRGGASPRWRSRRRARRPRTATARRPVAISSALSRERRGASSERAERLLGPDRVAVDVRAVERRHVDLGHDVRGQDPPQRLGQRDDLRPERLGADARPTSGARRCRGRRRRGTGLARGAWRDQSFRVLRGEDGRFASNSHVIKPDRHARARRVAFEVGRDDDEAVGPGRAREDRRAADGQGLDPPVRRSAPARNRPARRPRPACGRAGARPAGRASRPAARPGAGRSARRRSRRRRGNSPGCPAGARPARSPTNPRPVGLAGRSATPCTGELAQLGHEPRGVVLGPGRAAARDEDERPTAERRRPGRRGASRGRRAGGRRPAARRRRGRPGRRASTEFMSANRCPAGGVPGGSSSSPVIRIATTRPADHRDRRHPQPAQHAEVLRPEDPSRWEHHASPRRCPPRAADVPAGGYGLEDGDPVALARRRLDLDDRVGPRRDRRSGRDLDRLARPDLALEGPPRPDLAHAVEDGRRVGVGPEGLLAPDGVAVHRRAIERRHRHSPPRPPRPAPALPRPPGPPARRPSLATRPSISSITSPTVARARNPLMRGS